jgi:hypothetical protein
LIPYLITSDFLYCAHIVLNVILRKKITGNGTASILAITFT